MFPEHPRTAGALDFLQNKLSTKNLRALDALLKGTPLEILKTLPHDARPRLALDAYTAPDDEVSAGLSALLEYLKDVTKPDDFTKIGIMISDLMTLSRERLEDHDAEINHTANNANGNNNGPPAFKGKPKDPVAQDAMTNLRRRLNAKDTSSSDAVKRMLSHMDRLTPRDDTAGTLRRLEAHMSKIGIV